MTKLEKVLIEQLSKVSGVDITAIILAASENITMPAETPQKVKPAPKAEAPKAEAPKAEAPKAEAPKAEAPKAEASAPKVEAPAEKPAAGNVIAAFLEGDKAARGAIVSLASLAQLREINEAAKIGFDLSKYDDDSLAVARNKIMRWVNKQ
jgi:hypothetical protein